jgi:hypothetical protein
MCSIFEKGVPLKEHVGSRAVEASRMRDDKRARLVSVHHDCSGRVEMQRGIVKWSRDEFINCEPMLPLSRGVQLVHLFEGWEPSFAIMDYLDAA